MDSATGKSKSLAQLSAEQNETQYVSIEVGSKISGYTKDYLERLCRLNKVKFKLWNNGQHVIEVESLLQETHTILLSYEGISFVDKNELTDPPEQVPDAVFVPGAPVERLTVEQIGGEGRGILSHVSGTPNFSSIGAPPPPRKRGAGSPLAFVGRAVVSDSDHPSEAERAVEEATIINATTDDAPSPAFTTVTPIPVIPDVAAVENISPLLPAIERSRQMNPTI